MDTKQQAFLVFLLATCLLFPYWERTGMPEIPIYYM